MPDSPCACFPRSASAPPYLRTAGPVPPAPCRPARRVGAARLPSFTAAGGLCTDPPLHHRVVPRPRRGHMNRKAVPAWRRRHRPVAGNLRPGAAGRRPRASTGSAGALAPRRCGCCVALCAHAAPPSAHMAEWRVQRFTQDCNAGSVRHLGPQSPPFEDSKSPGHGSWLGPAPRL